MKSPKSSGALDAGVVEDPLITDGIVAGNIYLKSTLVIQ